MYRRGASVTNCALFHIGIPRSRGPQPSLDLGLPLRWSLQLLGDSVRHRIVDPYPEFECVSISRNASGCKCWVYKLAASV